MQNLLVTSLTGDNAIADAVPALVVRVENIYEAGDQYFAVDASADWSGSPVDAERSITRFDGGSEVDVLREEQSKGWALTAAQAQLLEDEDPDAWRRPALPATCAWQCAAAPFHGR